MTQIGNRAWMAGVLIACVWATALAQAPAGKTRITVASGVRVRVMPNTTAEEVVRLGVGTVVQELEQSPSKERIGSAQDYWYRVSTADGRTGWLFGGFTAPFDANDPITIYRRIAADRLKAEPASFGDMADLARFLSSVAKEATQPDAAAELELARLTAIHKAAESLPTDKQEQPPYQGWIKANQALIIYSEPGGQWMIKADLFWELAKQYRALAIGERIAWAAANLPLPGECEGDPICSMGYLNQTVGKYLRLYPRGVHAEEAMKNVIESLSGLVEASKHEGPLGSEYKADALKEFSALRATIQGTASPSKAAALDLLKAYEAYIRR